MKGATMKVTADEDKCCAAGSSVLAAPDVFDRRDEDSIVEDRRRPGQGIFGRLPRVPCPLLFQAACFRPPG
jgi:hypothetical protein